MQTKSQNSIWSKKSFVSDMVESFVYKSVYSAVILHGGPGVWSAVQYYTLLRALR